MSRLVVIAVFVVFCAATVAALRCYDCSPQSVTSGGCGDSFDNRSSSVSIISCAGSCQKVRASSSGNYAIQRGCTPVGMADQCLDVDVGSVKAKGCYCNTDLCNSATTTGLALPALLSTLFLGLTAAFIRV